MRKSRSQTSSEPSEPLTLLIASICAELGTPFLKKRAPTHQALFGPNKSTKNRTFSNASKKKMGQSCSPKSNKACKQKCYKTSNASPSSAAGSAAEPQIKSSTSTPRVLLSITWLEERKKTKHRTTIENHI